MRGEMAGGSSPEGESEDMRDSRPSAIASNPPPRWMLLESEDDASAPADGSSLAVRSELLDIGANRPEGVRRSAAPSPPSTEPSDERFGADASEASDLLVPVEMSDVLEPRFDRPRSDDELRRRPGRLVVW